MGFDGSVDPPPLPVPMTKREREADRKRLLRTKWFGAVLITASLAWSWHFMVKPLEDAGRDCQVDYSIKGVLLGPMFLYAGLVLLFADMRDEHMFTIDAYGRKRRTRRAWWFLAGALAVCALTMGGWFAALNRVGCSSGL